MVLKIMVLKIMVHRLQITAKFLYHCTHFDWFILMIYWRTDTKRTLLWQFFSSLLYLTDRFHVAVGVVSNSAQKKPKCGENIGNTLCCTLLDIFLF